MSRVTLIGLLILMSALQLHAQTLSVESPDETVADKSLSGAVIALRLTPERVLLDGPEASDQILVTGTTTDGQSVDLTGVATYDPPAAELVEVNATGRLSAVRDGAGEIIIRYGDLQHRLPVQVVGVQTPVPVSFRREILPLLTKAGCNSGGCHGKAEGQNGFKLSVFGYDAAADHAAIVSEGRGRRVFAAIPEQSLLLRKATAGMPHGGGQKFAEGSRWHRMLSRWISEGMVLDPEKQEGLVELRVEPSAVSLTARGRQQLRVTAKSADGTERFVTAEAEFQSNQDGIAAVDRSGLIQATDVPGEAAVLVRYSGLVAVCRVTRPREAVEFVRPPEHNFIDTLVWDKLQQLRIAPSPGVDDATFLRRVSLDTIGTLPTVQEARAFLADTSPDKRARLVQSLLQRPEYSDYWAQRWSDLLQVDRDIVGTEGAVAMTRWIRRQIDRNVPFDQFVRSVLTVQGATLVESPAAFYQVQENPEKLARSVSQLFLGVRLECAQCHHHPFERWDQADYFAFAGMFTGVQRKPDPRGGLKIIGRPGTPLKHPRTGQDIVPTVPGVPASGLPTTEDWRTAVAVWMTAPENPWFARTLANRIWAHYFGRGLVEPIDDLRATNPATNEKLLDALARHLVDLKFDVRQFTATLLGSYAYQLSVQVNESNRLDEQNYSHASWKPLPAEVLLDAVSQVTGVAESFNGWPAGYRAIQIWDNKLPSQFLEVFGRPTRQTVCACERGTEPSIAQALHLMNSTRTMEKVLSRQGRAAQLVQAGLSPEEILDELYLSALSRLPSEVEKQRMLQAFQEAGDNGAATQDVLWVLLNLREFVFNH